MTFTKTTDRARGQWKSILPNFGIDSRFLTARKGPCPICGGKDRFRFDDKDGDGTYFCQQCPDQAGTGLLLLRRFTGWDHKTACDAVDQIIGTDAPTAKAKPAAPVAQLSDARLVKIKRAISDARNPEIVEQYLVHRGLRIRSNVLLGHAACPYFDDNTPPRFVGSYRAIIAPITGPDGTLQSVQRVYWADLPTLKKTMPAVNTIKGGAIRLFDLDGDELGIAEGFGTAMAAAQMFGLPVWAAISADNLAAFEWPAQVKRLRIFGDNDESYTGHATAYALARRAKVKHLDVTVDIPEQINTDWLNVLNAREQAA